jgi:predicted RNase H-like HicB family nuclease
MKWAIVIEKTPGSNYSAYVLDLPGCITAADTLEETKELMRGAIEMHLAGMREDGDPIPEPTTQVEYIEAPRRDASQSPIGADCSAEALPA